MAILLPVALAIFWRRRSGAPWRALWTGVLVFFVSQVVLRIPWQAPLAVHLQSKTGGSGALWTGFLLLSCLTAGLFEETGRFVAYRTLLKNERNPCAAVLCGIGHGGLESILFVGLSLLGLLIAAKLGPAGAIPPGPGLDAMKRQLAELTPGGALAAGFERVSAIGLHVALSLVVLQVFTRGGLRWLWTAIALHAATNAAAVLLIKPLGTWPTEILVFLIVGGIFGWAVSLARGGGSPPTPVSSFSQSSAK
ncbi:MAG TPA: YhfC family glutamic-type intramembrane protease [Thermoanaerobaculia bacterium]|nr:YhfC family glutamic-type intramembrane protease [Thermoanaerobaculia bacterium]